MENKYSFVAVLGFAEDGINVLFPDLPGAITCGNDREDALRCAKECLELNLENMIADGDDMPEPSSMDCIVTAENEEAVLICTDIERE